MNPVGLAPSDCCQTVRRLAVGLDSQVYPWHRNRRSSLRSDEAPVVILTW